MAQQPTVTYSTVAVSAKKAIAALAEKSGMKIACSEAMQNEILVLRLQNAPIDKVLAKIASVTSGAWRNEGEISYLVPNTSVRNAEVATMRQAFATRIGDALKKQQEELAKAAKSPAPAAPAVPAPFMAMGAENPSMAKLAMAIGPRALAMVDEGSRIVFSSNPTRMQQALPPEAGPIIADFVTEYNKQAALAKQDEPAKTDADPNMAAIMEIFGNRMKKPVPITTAPAKALVVASRRGMFGGFTLDLKLYDANGKILANSSMPLVTDLPFDPQQFMKPAAPAPADEGPEIQLSPLSKELYQSGTAIGSMNGGNLKLSKELLAALKDPVERDPLSFMQSDALITISEKRNEQLVADLPDGVLTLFDNFGPRGKLTAASFLKEIKGDEKAKVSEADGWLVVSPNDPVKSRKQRTDRAALRALITASQSKGYASLDDVAAFVMRSESPLEGAPASTTYIMLFAPGAMQQGMMGMTNWDLVRLYGQLDPAQRQALRQGTKISFGQLSPDQQAQVSKMVFGADEVLMVENRQGGNQKKSDPLTELITSQIERFTGGNENDFRTEPTEIMSSGLPASGYVEVSFTSDPVGVPQTMSTDFGRGSAVGPLELGLFKFFKDDPAMSQVSGAIPTLDDLKVGTRSVYNFSFFVAQDVSEKGQLNDDLIPKDAPTYKLANLPSNFQKRVDEMAASFKNNPIWKMIGQMGGFGQRGVPPQ